MSRSRPASSGRPSRPEAEPGDSSLPGRASSPGGDDRTRGSSRRRPTAGWPAVALLALLAALLAPLERGQAQQRRGGAVPYAPDAAGELLVGLGGALEEGSSFPLSGLRGDLARLGTLTVSYSFAPGAVFRLHGDVLRVLSVERRGESAVPLEEGVEDGTTHDAGDFRLSTLFRLFGEPEGLSAGLHLAVKLPNSDESAGIGLNTTDVFASAFGSWGRGAWRVNGDLGVGILEAPLEPFVQDDVLTYAGEVLFRPEGWDVRLSAAVQGRANTRQAVPRGNEDRGRAGLSVELLTGPWRADLGLRHGYADSSPDWSVVAGVARAFRP